MALDENSLLNRWRRNFLAGLAITMPGVISLAVVVWLFRNVANVTDTLLFFLPKKLTHPPGSETAYWYWSYFAFLLAVSLICLVGRFGRDYLGRRAIKWTDKALLSIPLLNKIYGTVKQVNESFSSNKSSFKQVVLVPFPHAASRAIGFVTGEQITLGNEKWVGVFVPTTPLPTSGFLLLYAERDLVKLDMSVPDAIKFIISLGAISPGNPGAALPPAQSADQESAPKT
ncbi:MAG: DUF502 domain-containing protein [Verrucomicrobiota bacterium]|jgi:uncharacterized membrane protein